jgi:Flp pilus assembly protein TadG
VRYRGSSRDLGAAERGSITAFVVVIAMTFIACAGLALDGGRLVAAKVELADDAENAARVGAQEITSFRSGNPTIDKPRAFDAVTRYLTEHDVSGEVSINDNEVTVRVTRLVRMTLLSLFGVTAKIVTAQRTATPVNGS